MATCLQGAQPAPPPAAPPDRPTDALHRPTARLTAREDEVRAALTAVRAEARALEAELRRKGPLSERSTRLRDLRESRLHAELGRLRRDLAAARGQPAP